MIDKEKYPKLYETTENIINRRQRWLRDALQSQLLCEFLPEEIKTLNIISVDLKADGTTLHLSIISEDGTIALLKTLGIQGLKPHASGKNSFQSTGEGVLLNGTKFEIYVSNINKPEGCRIEEHPVTYTEYTLVCEESGKPL